MTMPDLEFGSRVTDRRNVSDMTGLSERGIAGMSERLAGDPCYNASVQVRPGARLAQALASETPLLACLRKISEAECALADAKSSLKDICNFSNEAEPISVVGTPSVTSLRQPSKEKKLDFTCSADSQMTDATATKTSDSYQGVSSKNVNLSRSLSKNLTKAGTLMSMDDPETVRSLSQSPHVSSPDKVEELINLCSELDVDKAEFDQIVEFFEIGNTTGSGKLSLEELQRFIEDMCEGTIMASEVEEIINRFDHDGDQKLTLSEFIQAFAGTPFIQAAHVGQQLSKMGDHALDQMAECKMRDDASTWVMKVGVPGKTVYRYIGKELEEAGACLSLPLTLVMFLLLLLTVSLHFGIESAHAVDQSIIWDVLENANFAFSGSVPLETGRMGHKNMDDINSFADFWSWFNLGVVPLFWPQGWDISEARSNIAAACLPSHATLADQGFGAGIPASFATSSRNYASGWNQSWCPEGGDAPERPAVLGEVPAYLFYHTVVGGVRLRQERSNIVPCPSEDKFTKAVYPGQCIDTNSYWLEPELHQALPIDESMVNQTGGETMYLLSGWSQAKVRQELRALENKVWLSPQTTKVEMLLTTYNPHMNVLTATYIMLFLNRGGHIYKVIEPTCFYMDPYRDWGSVFVDVALLLIFLKIVAEEGFEILSQVYSSGCMQGLHEYCSPSNVVDWLSVLYFLALVTLGFDQVLKLANLRDTLALVDWNEPGSWVNPDIRIKFYEDVDTYVQRFIIFRTIVGFFPFILGCRFLKACAAQPRLAIMTNTLKKSFKDLVHFFVVFGCVFLVYSMSALTLFGTELEEFSNPGRAVNTVFLVVQGNYDFERMLRIGRIQAGLWYWSFECIVKLCMLNMLLAIIMDVYTDVKGNVQRDAETLWSQSHEIFQRWRAVRRGEELPLDQIIEALNPVSETPWERLKNRILRRRKPVRSTPSGKPITMEQRVTVERLRNLVPELPEDQATRLLLDAHKLDKEERKAGSALSDNAKTTRTILRNTEVIHGAIARLININQMHSAIMKNNHMDLSRKVADGTSDFARGRDRSIRYDQNKKVSERLSGSLVEANTL